MATQRREFYGCHRGQLISLDVIYDVLRDIPFPYEKKSTPKVQKKGTDGHDGVIGYFVFGPQGKKVELETFPLEGTLRMTIDGPSVSSEKLVPADEFLEREFGYKGLPVDPAMSLR